MLVLTRKEGEKIVIEGGIVVTVTKVRGNRAWVGIDAPKHLTVNREEIQLKVLTEGSKRDASANTNQA